MCRLTQRKPGRSTITGQTINDIFILSQTYHTGFNFAENIMLSSIKRNDINNIQCCSFSTGKSSTSDNSSACLQALDKVTGVPNAFSTKKDGSTINNPLGSFAESVITTASSNKIPSCAKTLPNGVPAELHYVWEGDKISQNDLANILLMAMNAKSFNINVWTTRPMSILATLEDMCNIGSDVHNVKLEKGDKGSFRFLARKYGDLIHIQDPHKLYAELESTPFVNSLIKNGENKDAAAHNVNTATFLHSIFYRETNGSYKNYAAASDITRAVLMYLKGGCYLDVDTVCLSLENVGELEMPFGYFIGYDKRKVLTNCMLASLPQSDLSKEILQKIAQGLVTANEITDGISLLWDDKRSKPQYRQDDTLNLTGPGVFWDLELQKREGVCIKLMMLSRAPKYIRSMEKKPKWIGSVLFSQMKRRPNYDATWVHGAGIEYRPTMSPF
ncbi:glycosyltransferase [Salmonella enterica]